MERDEALLSVVIPAWNEEEMLPKAAATIAAMLRREDIAFELIFVDDGSRDGTWACIAACAQQDSCVRGLRFSRNFGKEAAISAGLAAATGSCVAVMDCDLQHPPETLLEMYRLWQQGYEVVEAVKRDRGRESLAYKLGAKSFYHLISRATKIDMSHASDFKLLDRKAVTALLQMPEKVAFFRAMSSWIGFRTTTVEFDVRAREAGQSKWSVGSLMRYAVRNIVSYTALPMQLITLAGVLVLLLALAMGIQTLVRYFSGTAVEGFTTVILLLLLLGSAIMISLGIIGYYISRIFEEVKARPKYFVAAKTDEKK